MYNDVRKFDRELVNNIPLWFCIAASPYFIFTFLSVALLSLTYPFQLEWMEGSTIDIIQRIRNGLPVFTEPSIEYVPFTYTPFYFYVSAAVSLFTGVDFLPARLVSLLATLGTAAIIFQWIRKEAGSYIPALIGASLFFASYKITGRWFDIARVDSLFVMLSMAALYWFYHYRGQRNALIAAGLMVLAFFTKQSAAIIFAPVFLAMVLIDRRHALRVWSALACALFILIGFLNVATDNWFSFFAFVLPSHHSIQHKHIGGFWSEDLFRGAAFAVVLSIIALKQLTRESTEKGLFYTALCVGLVLCSYTSRLNWGGYINVLIPAYAAFAMLTGMLVAKLPSWAALPKNAALLAVCAQMVLMVYNPLPLIPKQKSVRTGNDFLQKIGAIKGDVLIPERQFVSTRVGKKSYTLGMAATDLLRTDLGDRKYVQAELMEEIANAISGQRFGAILPGGLIPMPELKRYYYSVGDLEFPEEYVTGATNFLRKTVFVPELHENQSIVPGDKPDLTAIPE